MLELLLFISGIVGLIATRAIWNAYLKVASDKTRLWVKVAENELQPEIKAIHDKRQTIITQQGKWYNVEDIDKLKA